MAITVPGPEHLSPERFEEIFGFRPKEPLSEEEHLHVDQTNVLFDRMFLKYNMREAEIFDIVGERAKFCAFLHDVRACPESVLDYCRAALAPGSTFQRPKMH